MSIAEQTKFMIDSLPESQVVVIYQLVKDFSEKKESPFQPLSRTQILNNLATSREQFANGEYEDFDDAIEEIGAKYGI